MHLLQGDPPDGASGRVVDDVAAPDVTTPPRARPRRRGVGPFSLRQIGLAFGSVIVVAVVLALATRPLGSVDGPAPVNPNQSAFPIASPVEGLTPGSRAPEFSVTLDDGTTFQLADLDGQPIRLADLRGKAVWVNFWATWCGPCQSETPILRAMDEAYRDRGLVLVAADVQETVADARAYAERYGLEYTIGADVSAHVLHAYRAFALPTHFFIDPDGIIRFVEARPLSEDAARQRIEAILPPAG